jgi:DNA-directed RNA polymerase specialized sigma24 family protein
MLLRDEDVEGPLGAEKAQYAPLSVRVRPSEGRRLAAPAPVLSSERDSATPEDAVAFSEQTPLLHAALSSIMRTLPRAELSLLQLYFVSQLSIDEIGRAHRVHRSTIAWRIQRCIRCIQQRLQRQLR